MNYDDEQQIIRELKRGDTGHYRLLIERYQQPVYSLVYTILDHREDAEEVTQDVFFTVYRKIGQLKDPARFSGWLFRIAYHLSLNKARDRRHKNRIIPIVELEDPVLRSEQQIAGHLHQEDRQRLIDQALQQLKPEDKLLIQLYYLQELSIKEISAITKLKESNIKVKLMRSRQLLLGILTTIRKEYE